jgi:hypothetical protein
MKPTVKTSRMLNDLWSTDAASLVRPGVCCELLRPIVVAPTSKIDFHPQPRNDRRVHRLPNGTDKSRLVCRRSYRAAKSTSSPTPCPVLSLCEKRRRPSLTPQRTTFLDSTRVSGSPAPAQTGQKRSDAQAPNHSNFLTGRARFFGTAAHHLLPFISQPSCPHQSQEWPWLRRNRAAHAPRAGERETTCPPPAPHRI